MLIFAPVPRKECDKYNKIMCISNTPRMENVRKNGLRKLYDSLPAAKVTAPKAELIRHLAEITMSHEQTVKAWLYGVQVPDKLKQEIIARDLGKTTEELFG